MLVELGLVEQRYKAVLEVLEGAATVTDVARRYGVGRQTVHRWLRSYATSGLAGLVDKSSKPDTCPHQMPPHIEAKVLEMRRIHPQWGPRTILNRLVRAGADPLPSRSAIYRCLVRHVLLEPKPRKRKPSDYKRWERSRPMELWQMDVTLGVRLADGSRPSVVDRHRRPLPVLRVRHGGGAGHRQPGVRGAARGYGPPRPARGHLERQRQGLHRSFRAGKGHRALRPHLLRARHSPSAHGPGVAHHHGQGGALPQDLEARVPRRQGLRLGRRGPRGHRRLGAELQPRPRAPEPRRPAAHRSLRPGPARAPGDEDVSPAPATRPGETRLLRRVHRSGKIDVLRFKYHVGRHLSGQTVEVFSRDGLLEVFADGVLVATHARRHLLDEEMRLHRSAISASDPAPAGPVVIRKVNGQGSVSFAGTQYRVGNAYRRRSVELTVTRDTVSISLEGKLLRTHPKRHDRGKEHGALGNPGGRPDRVNAA